MRFIYPVESNKAVASIKTFLYYIELPDFFGRGRGYGQLCLPFFEFPYHPEMRFPGFEAYPENQ